MAVRSGMIQAAGGEVDSLSEDRVLNTESEEIVRYFVEKYHVEVPVIFRDRLVADRSEQNINEMDAFNRGERIVRGVVFTFELPFEGDPNVFQMVPSTRNSNPPFAAIRGGNIVFSISGREVTTEQVQRGVNDLVNNVEQYLGWHRELWGGFDSELSSAVRARLQRRREQLKKQLDVTNSLTALGIKLKEKADDPRTYAAPAIRQKIAPQLPPMKPRQPPEPTLDSAQYDKILQLVRDSARSIERSSSRTRELDEESLRDLLLVPLNAHFEGAATGEAFNYSGKTDILVRHDGGNLFVAECKFWSGQKQLLEAIDQVLSYLTWRDTKTALIVFSRNAAFSGVVNKLAEAPKSHPCYVSGPTRSDESTFRYTFRLPSDPDRQLTLTVLGFDLGSPDGNGPRVRQV